jgi:hypothetical protein
MLYSFLSYLGVIHEVGVFKTSSKWPLVTEEHCVFLFMFMVENVFSHLCFQKCWLFSVQRQWGFFVLFTVQAFVEVFISPSSRVTELSPRVYRGHNSLLLLNLHELDHQLYLVLSVALFNNHLLMATFIFSGAGVNIYTPEYRTEVQIMTVNICSIMVICSRILKLNFISAQGLDHHWFPNRDKDLSFLQNIQTSRGVCPTS